MKRLILQILLVGCWLIAFVPSVAAHALALYSPEVPPGFRLILETTGVKLYQKDYKNGQPDFVQVVDLNQGARIELLHGAIAAAGADKGVYGGDNPRFTRLPLENFWKDFSSSNSNAFCITNGVFFYMPQDPPPIAYPLKIDGVVLSDGYGIKEYPGQKLILQLWGDRALISDLSQESLYSSSAPDLVGGLTEIANKRAKFAVGRTFVGTADPNGDRTYGTVLIFNTSAAKQEAAAEVLRSFGADQVMMLDGGGSTQLICQGNSIIASDRPIPQAIGILAGDGNKPEITLSSIKNKMIELTASPQPSPSPQLTNLGKYYSQDFPETEILTSEKLSLNDSLLVPAVLAPFSLIVMLIILKNRSHFRG